MTQETIIGIDVSKTALDVWIHPEGRTWRCEYTEEELAHLAPELGRLQPSRLIIEATGGLETPLASELCAAGSPVVVVNPRQVREFARASGRLAKTDRLDAELLAQFGSVLRPPVRPLPDPALRELRALVSRRRQLIAMQTQERNRQGQAPSRVVEQIGQHITLLGTHIDQLDRDIAGLLRDNAHWQARARLLRSIPGVGPTLTASLIAQLPELGQATHKEIAALAGVAPFNRDSGTMRGKRSVWGGRGQLRGVLYMATLVATKCNPAIRACYQRLRGAGKPAKVALTACMRKLLIICNAVIKNETPWNPALALVTT